ncbi:MAG: hypothetical protein ACK4PC_03470 [Sphingopyxis sp.]
MVSIRRSGLAAVAVRVGTAPLVLDVPAERAALEAQMVEAVRLSWRLRDPVGRGSPFASDGPWHLMQRDMRAGDYDARGGDMEEAPAPREELDAVDLAQIDAAAGWLQMLLDRPARAGQTSAASDGAIVAAVLRQKAAGRTQVDWSAVLRVTGLARGKGALRFRYERAMAWLAARVAKG